jgi:hypothetical protein
MRFAAPRSFPLSISMRPSSLSCPRLRHTDARLELVALTRLATLARLSPLRSAQRHNEM